jgi:hypothetical protein
MSVAAQLPVPQVRESHALYINPTEIDATATVVAPPYAGMAAGDVVDFHFDSIVPVTLTFEVEPDDIGKPITWRLDANDLWMAYPGEAAAWYEVTRGGTVVATSSTQTFIVDEGPDDLLPAPEVDDVGEDGLDPSLFPDGVNVTAPLYDGAAVGDVVLLYWTGAQVAKSTVEWHALTQADISRGEIGIPVAPEWLEANIGGDVTLTYQYAREGAAGSSLARTVTVLVPLVLAAPLVEKADAEGGDEHGNRKGFLMAADARNGAYVSVPDVDELADATALAVHWDGHPNGGKHVADAPHAPGTPLRFFIPKGAVAANMGADNRRFDVFYAATLANGRDYTSRAFQLWIKPLAISEYTPPQCRQAQGKPGLSLADVPPEGAEIYLTTWPFIEPGQQLTLWIVGVEAVGRAVEYIARNAVPVTQAEITAKTIAGRVPASVLQTLKVNELFNLRGKVSYNGGDTAMSFQVTNVRWLG